MSKEKRTIRQTVNFTKSEYDKIKAKADELSLNLTEFLRYSAARLKVVKQNPDYEKLITKFENLSDALDRIDSDLIDIESNKEITEKEQKALQSLRKQLDENFDEFRQIKDLMEELPKQEEKN